jgi:hypothetical protein
MKYKNNPHVVQMTDFLVILPTGKYGRRVLSYIIMRFVVAGRIIIYALVS